MKCVNCVNFTENCIFRGKCARCWFIVGTWYARLLMLYKSIMVRKSSTVPLLPFQRAQAIVSYSTCTTMIRFLLMLALACTFWILNFEFWFIFFLSINHAFSLIAISLLISPQIPRIPLKIPFECNICFEASSTALALRCGEQEKLN